MAHGVSSLGVLSFGFEWKIRPRSLGAAGAFCNSTGQLPVIRWIDWIFWFFRVRSSGVGHFFCGLKKFLQAVDNRPFARFLWRQNPWFFLSAEKIFSAFSLHITIFRDRILRVDSAVEMLSRQRTHRDVANW
jgi:hypothetical protein